MNKSWIFKFIVLKTSFANYCVDILENCASINKSLCGLTIIQEGCPKTCQTNWTTCDHEFNFVGWVAFLFYMVIFFLLLVICILAYSLCIDQRLLQQSIKRFSKKRSRRQQNNPNDNELPFLNIADTSWRCVQAGRELKWQLQPNARPSLMNPNSLIRKSMSEYTVTDPIDDIMINENVWEEKRFIADDHNLEVKHFSHHIEHSKVKEVGTETNDDKHHECLDYKDDFIKHAIVPDYDDIELPPSSRVGGHRQSQALSNKSETRKKTISKNPLEFNSTFDNVILKNNNKRTLKRSKTWSCEVSHKPTSKAFLKCPEVLNKRNFKSPPVFHHRRHSSNQYSLSLARLRLSLDCDVLCENEVDEPVITSPVVVGEVTDEFSGPDLSRTDSHIGNEGALRRLTEVIQNSSSEEGIVPYDTTVINYLYKFQERSTEDSDNEGTVRCIINESEDLGSYISEEHKEPNSYNFRHRISKSVGDLSSYHQRQILGKLKNDNRIFLIPSANDLFSEDSHATDL